MRTTLWRYHLGGGLALALAYVYLPVPALRAAALAVLGLATIAATLAALRLWRPLRRLPFYLFAAGEAVGFVAGSMGSSVAVTGAGGNPAAAALTIAPTWSTSPASPWWSAPAPPAGTGWDGSTRP